MRQIYLNFHGIGRPERALEPGEAAYWVSREFFGETLRLVKRLEDRVKTGFTFDDGNLSDIEIGAEELAHHGRAAHFFILSSRIGQPGSLGPTEISDLQKMGHEIGTHGADHVDWTTLDGTGLTHELDTARNIVERISGHPVAAAAIPFGRYNRAVLNALQARGYKRIYSSDGGTWHAGQVPIPRSSPRADMDVSDIEAILLGHESVKRRLRRSLAMAIKRRL